MNSKKIWEHLSKELAKANTILDLSRGVIGSVLFTRFNRYGAFTCTILDAYTKAIFLTVYYLFDNRRSWSLYDLSGLSSDEVKKVDAFKKQAEKYIKVRHQKIGHSSKELDVGDHKRLWWVSGDELGKIQELFKELSRFLNAYGMRKFNEGYSFHYGGPDSSLQCLIEDLEKPAIK